ncbi:hypothetical protein F383_36750 [Gossypium arboreum]|uniref:Uncharacterized protein n=1 Tax=Gossypium arboreum TaxID=29729 RepID=A0A0B0MB29_GOSAR|nr:hypothetical protein F383_36750 [Gossypium arboreum]
MIFGEKEISAMKIEFLLKNMERTKAKLYGGESVYRKMSKICVTPSPIYSTKKPSIFLIKF